MKPRAKGIILIIIASLLVGTSPILAKLAHLETQTLSTLTIRAMSAAIVALVYILVTKTSLNINKKTFYVILFIAFSAIIIGDSIFIYALEILPAVNAALILNIQPLFIILIGFMILGKDENLSKISYINIIIMIFAIFLIITKTPDNLFGLKLGVIGDLLVIIAVIAWSFSDVVVKRHIKENHAAILVFYPYLISAVILSLFLAPSFTTSQLSIWPVIMGLFHGTQVILYYEGLKYIKVALASGLGKLATVFTIFLAFIIFKETMTPMQIIGTIVLLVSAYFLVQYDNRKFF